jgi:hypothetical protein
MKIEKIYNRRMPEDAAKLIIELGLKFGTHRSRTVTRFRITDKTFKIIVGHPSVNDNYYKELQGELISYGWIIVYTGNYYGVIKTASMEQWARIGGKSVVDTLNKK